MKNNITLFMILLSFSNLFSMDEDKLPNIKALKEAFPNTQLVHAGSYGVITLCNNNESYAYSIYVDGDESNVLLKGPIKTQEYSTILTIHNKNTGNAVRTQKFLKALTIEEIIKHIQELDEQYGKSINERAHNDTTSSNATPEMIKDSATKPMMNDSQAPLTDQGANEPINGIPDQEIKPNAVNSSHGLLGEDFFLGAPVKIWTYSLGTAVAVGISYLAYRLYKKKKGKKPQSVVIISNGSLPA